MDVTGGESATTARVAEEAAGCVLLRRAVALEEWAGPSGRALTSVGVLRKPDVPAACAAIGVKLPERFRSAGDIQDLHRPWTVAIALGLLTVNSGRVASGPTSGQWPPTAAALPGRWLDGLLAVCEATCQDSRRSLGLRLQLLALLHILSDPKPGRHPLVFHDLLATARGIGDEHGLGYGEVDLTGGCNDLSQGFAHDIVDALLDLLADFGAVNVPEGGVTSPARAERHARALPAITPLGRWAAEALAASLPRPVGPDTPPAETIAAAAQATREGWSATVHRWLSAREPEVAVRELLQSADPLPARLRAAAVAIARMTGQDGLPGWAAIARAAETWPNSARYARAELRLWHMDDTGVVPSPDAADWHWLAVEAAAAALDPVEATADQGADEALCRLWAAAGETDSIDGVLAWARASGHPEATRVSGAITALAASGAPLTVRQGIQLKVTLRHSRPPTWRSVQVPLLFTLGDLHRVIQVLFGWDGDHLHQFAVGTTRYSDPFFGLDETEDEEEARLRDAFPAGGRKPVRYEYDFGASWVHEITREKVFEIGPAEPRPACVAFSGEQPVEYDEGEYSAEDQQNRKEPFTLAAVNAALAKLVATEDAPDLE